MIAVETDSGDTEDIIWKLKLMRCGRLDLRGVQIERGIKEEAHVFDLGEWWYHSIMKWKHL